MYSIVQYHYRTEFCLTGLIFLFYAHNNTSYFGTIFLSYSIDSTSLSQTCTQKLKYNIFSRGK